MMKKRYLLVTHVFKGGRFDDHGLDIDVLPDLIAYKNLLVETAKETWRRKHPNRQRLPKNFEDSLALKFYELKPGSTAVPLVREIEILEGLFASEQGRDELDEAAELVTQAIDAAAHDRPLPEAFPKSMLRAFEDYGKTLRDDEAFEYKLETRRDLSSVRYSKKERERLCTLAGREYQDIVEMEGEIRSADLDGLHFSLRLEDGSKVTGKFQPSQEAVITEALREHASRRLQVKGHAEYWPDGKLKRIIDLKDLIIHPLGEDRYDDTARPIWEVATELGNLVPPEEWDKIPSDLSKNFDHYLYSSAKDDQ